MLAAPVVVDDRAVGAVSDGAGVRFWKLSGSGNDFVFFHTADDLPDALRTPAGIRAVAARGTGIGADGVVFLEASPGHPTRITYFNADGSPAELCGNATLCTTRLATTLGAADPAGLAIETGAGRIAARIAEGEPEIDLEPVTVLRVDEPLAATVGPEERIGYAIAGVPHLVVLVPDVESVDVAARGRVLRHTPGLAGGANVNFVSRAGDGEWSIRTFERGVEGETLACGTGAVSTGLLLASWGLADLPVRLRTRSGRVVTVSGRRDGDSWWPRLRGEGRIVFEGRLPID